MRAVIVTVGVAVLLAVVLADKPPQVYVYMREPPEVGKKNQLICHCTNFHPPLIKMNLKEGDQQMEDCKQTDMTFREDWAYYSTLYKDIMYRDGVQYGCEVQHNEGPIKTHLLDPMI